MTYKDTKPYMSAFLSVDLLTDFAAFCLTDFIDWRYTHSWFVFSTQLVNSCPPWMGRNYTYVLLSVAPLLYLLSDLLPPPPFPMYRTYIQTMCDCGWRGRGVEMYCGLWYRRKYIITQQAEFLVILYVSVWTWIYPEVLSPEADLRPQSFTHSGQREDLGSGQPVIWTLWSI